MNSQPVNPEIFQELLSGINDEDASRLTALSNIIFDTWHFSGKNIDIAPMLDSAALWPKMFLGRMAIQARESEKRLESEATNGTITAFFRQTGKILKYEPETIAKMSRYHEELATLRQKPSADTCWRAAAELAVDINHSKMVGRFSVSPLRAIPDTAYPTAATLEALSVDTSSRPADLSFKRRHTALSHHPNESVLWTEAVHGLFVSTAHLALKMSGHENPNPLVL